MLRDRISEDMKKALKSRDKLTLDTIRMVLSAIKNKEIEKKRNLDDSLVEALISTLVKQRREAAELYRKGDREELAQKEEKEIAILKAYLPKALSEAELIAIIDAAISETGASSPAEMGKVMKLVMSKTAGKAEGKIVGALVRKQLSAAA